MQHNRAWNAIRIGVWVVSGLVVLVALLFSATAIALPGCSSCHDSSAFVSQTKAHSHATIDCVRCHVGAGIVHRVTYAYNLVLGQTLRVAPADGGPITAIPDTTCLSCHADVMGKEITAGGLSILHEKCAKGRRCVDCHSDTAHGTAVVWNKTSDMNQCLECHAVDRVRSGCDVCHGERSVKDRIRTGEWAVTHGAAWRKTHGMGDLKTCAACHENGFCVECHGLPLPHDADFIRTHPALALARRNDCAVCHQQSFCDSCHGLPMPHPAGFTPKHWSIVRKQGRDTCMRCHVEDDCTTCHVRHVHPGGAKLPPGRTGT